MPTCNGTEWHAATPFEGLFDGVTRGIGAGSERYTNAQLWELFDPSGDHIPYVYDTYTSFGDCEWDPWTDAA